MSGNKRCGFYLPLIFIFLVIASPKTSGQNLLAVFDLVSDGSVPQKNCARIADTISAIAASDSTYMQFDRSMIPELLKQLTVEESATACSDPQCLVLIGNLIGANTVIGGFIRYKNRVTEIELNLVSVAEKRALNTVSMSTGSNKSVILSSEVPALVRNLLNPKATPPPTKLIATKRSFFANPLLYVGTVVVGGAAAGAYYYKNFYNGPDGEKPPVIVDPPKDETLSLDDAPARGE